jgi:hypothetical protein
VPLGVALAGVYSLDVSPIGDWRSPEPDLSDARQVPAGPVTAHLEPPYCRSACASANGPMQANLGGTE